MAYELQKTRSKWRLQLRPNESIRVFFAVEYLRSWLSILSKWAQLVKIKY
jgi:hypothetical protein